MLLEQPGRVLQRILAKLILVSLNLLVAESAAAQLELGPLHFAAALAAEQRRGQLPIGRGRQQGRDLLAGPLLLVIVKLPLRRSSRNASRSSPSVSKPPNRSATRASAPEAPAS